MISKRFISALIVSVVLVAGALWLSSRPTSGGSRAGEFQAAENELETRLVSIGEQTYVVEVAKTAEQQALGLGNRDSLPETNGMLFPFLPSRIVSFWMKDMRFAIDIVWISNDRVVGVERNVPAPGAETLPQDLPTYSPPTEVDYVLELNAGQSQFFDVGDEVVITAIEST